MGLRGKILALFLFGFGLMALVAVEYLQRDLLPSFVAIERNAALAQLEQLVRNVDAELEHLHQADTDWANWDEMYGVMSTWDAHFAASGMGPPALKSAGLNFIVLIDTHRAVHFRAATDAHGAAADFTPYQGVVGDVTSLLARSGNEDSCGLDATAAGAVLLCWQPIHRGDGSGQDVGIILVGRRMDEAMAARIRRQSGIEFDWMAMTQAGAPAALVAQRAIGPYAVQFSPVEDGMLGGQLHDILARPALSIRLHFPREVSARGAATTWRVIEVLLAVTVLNGLALLVGIHYLLVHPLRVLSKGVKRAGSGGSWSPLAEVPGGADEIGNLGRDINRLLQVIRDQVISLESLARTDSLTRIPNRRAFDEALVREARQHRRDGTPLALVLIDVDFFKRYNDVYGHPAGDEVLKTIGTLLTLVARRPTDLPARIGGEEFALILPHSDLPSACAVAEKLAGLLAVRAISHSGSVVTDVVSLSIGVTLAGDEDASAILLRADRAVYAAKEAGRNRICALPPPAPEAGTVPPGLPG